MRFDPVITSKADGKGYNYNCPRGWVINPNPCKTLANGNSNNNTVLPIRDVDNNVTYTAGTSSGSNTIGTAVPNRGAGLGPANNWVPLSFAGNLWMDND